LPKREDPKLLVGFHTSDDAGIYRLTDELAVVSTADYITPPVNDGYLFGQIAAANALSDIYAMGATPVMCLNLVNFPSQKLPAETLHQIVQGALSKITEAGAVLAGGHSVEDDEPKFGLAVTGTVHPDRYWANTGAQPGDVLILTKPLGSGVLFNANLKGWVSKAALDKCIGTLTRLNRTAAEILRRFDVHAATDITGCGLAGHSLEIARGSNVTLVIEGDSVPAMDESLAMYEKGMTTGVNSHNRKLVQRHFEFGSKRKPWQEELFFDPQTSGGLLVSIPKAQGQGALEALIGQGETEVQVIGEVYPFNGRTHVLVA